MLASQTQAPLRREGLGLGGVDMPAELRGTMPDPSAVASKSSRTSTKTPRSRSRGHAPSHSSPSSLAPFAASLPDAASSARPPPRPANSAPGLVPVPAPTSRMLVVDGTCPAAPAAIARTAPVSGSKRTVKQPISSGLISYPMVARIDSTPTYTPAAEVPPVPVRAMIKAGPLATTGGASSVDEAKKAAARERPTPIKAHSSTGASFLSPLKSRFGKSGGKEKDSGASAEEESERNRSWSGKGKVDMLIAQNNAAIQTAFPDLVQAATAEDSPEADLTIALPTKYASGRSASLGDIRTNAGHAEVDGVAVGVALGSPLHGPSSAAAGGDSASTSATQARPMHRRGISDQSPQIVQSAFARIADFDGAAKRPTTLYSIPTHTAADARRPSVVTAATSSALKARQRAQSVQPPSRPPLSVLANISDAFFPPADPPCSTTPTTIPTMSRRPSLAPGALSAAISVGISMREGATAEPREVGRAVCGSDGLTVSLRSYHRPDELEVGWVCVPCTDDQGRAYTSWEIRLKPRSNAAPPTLAVPPLQSSSTSLPEGSSLRARTPSTSAAAFQNYRMNAAPSVPSPDDPSGVYPPRSQSAPRRPSQPHSPTTPTGALPSRKMSNRSDASSYGGSFSSDSSFPAGFSRKGKLPSVSTIATSVAEEDTPFDDMETLKLSYGFQGPLSDSLGARAGYFSRPNRTSSYAPGAEGFPRDRQFSIDEENIMNRASSFSVGPGVAHRPKSSRHHRFGAYVPPLWQTGGAEFAQLAQQMKRKNQLARDGSSVVEGREDDLTMEPTIPSSDRHVRRSQGMTDALPPLPPLPAFSLGEEGHEDSTVPTVPNKSFLDGARAGRRKQSIAPPAALVLPPPQSSGRGEDTGSVSPSAVTPSAPHRTPLGAPRLAGADVFGPTTPADLLTPTRPYAPTPPPKIPLPTVPALASDGRQRQRRPASPTSSSSHSPSVSERSVTDDDDDDDDDHAGDDSEEDPEIKDVQNASIQLVQTQNPAARRRQLSHWSETDDDEDEEGEAGDGSECQTSWCRVPDAPATSEEEE